MYVEFSSILKACECDPWAVYTIQEKSKVLDQLSESQASFELFLKFKEEVEGE